MTGFSEINRVNIPFKKLEEVYDHLRNAGEKRVEGVALFSGKVENTSFNVLNTIIPKQETFNHDGGLLYTVDAEELHRINVWLYRNSQKLICQIHSHPSEAYHSDTDDAYPIITTVGGISIVVPDFGFGDLDPRLWAVYRLINRNSWEELNQFEVDSLIKILD